jgi:hypothetical protein
VLLASEDDDEHLRPGLGDASRLDQRRERVGGERKAVEGRHHVERTVLVREELDVADIEASTRDALQRDLDHPRCRVDAGDASTGGSRQATESSGAAPGTEIRGPSPSA